MSKDNNNRPKLVVIKNDSDISSAQQKPESVSNNAAKSNKNKKQGSAERKRPQAKSSAKNKKPLMVRLFSAIAVFFKNAISGILKLIGSLALSFLSLFRNFNLQKGILLVMLVCMTGGIVYLLTNGKVSVLDTKDNLFSTEFGVNSSADFYVLNKKIFYCTKDTATLLDKNGKPVWSDTLSMVSPALLGEGNFVAIADIKNKLLNVYGEEGKVYSIEAEGNITAFAVNELGATAVICKNSTDTDYSMTVYNSEGQKMFMGSYVSQDGIPMTVDINKDSTKVAVGFVDVSSLNLTSSVLFYSTDKTEAAKIENSDAMFAAVKCDKELVGNITFLDNDSCIIATDKSLLNIGNDNVSSYEQNWKIDFTNYVTALNVVGDDYIAVAYGDKTGDVSTDTVKNSIFWYKTSNGKIKGSATMETSVSNLKSGLGFTIAELDNNTFVSLKPSGQELWRYDGLQNIVNILFYNSSDTVAVISTNKMTLTNIKNGAENTEMGDEPSDTNAPEDTTEAQTAPPTQQTTQAAE